MATPSTIEATVPFQDPQGNVLANGTLTLDLSQPALITSGGGDVAPLRVVLPLDSNGMILNQPVNLWANDQLSPAGTSYRVRVYNSNGLLVADLGQLVIAGTPPIDISQIAPSSTSPVTGIGGTIGATEIAFGTGSNTIGGNPGFTFDTSITKESLATTTTSTTSLLDVDNNATVATTPDLGTVMIRGKGMGSNGAAGPTLLMLMGDDVSESGPYGWIVKNATSPNSFINALMFTELGNDVPLIQMFSESSGTTLALGTNDLGDQTSLDSSGGILLRTGVGGSHAGVITLSATTVSMNGALSFTGSTGNAAIGVASAAGTPNQINLPIATAATSNAALFSDGGSPQQTSWVAASKIVATVNLTAQAANIGLTTLYAVPSGAAGMYRVTCGVQLTRSGTASSTLPAFGVTWTDEDTGLSTTQIISSTNATNAVGSTYGVPYLYVPFNVQASTTMQYATSSYASSGATTMQYSLHVRVEYLG